MIPIAKPMISEEDIRKVSNVLRSGHLVAGENVKKFEERFASYIGVKYGIASSNGTTALHTALLALGIGPGDEIITTPFSFVASSNCILYVGAKPVFVDIDPKTFNIDPAKIEEKITPRTKAVLVVHIFGQACDMSPIVDLCRDRNLFLIEDACQAHGAEYKNKKVGSFGDVSCFSFYPTKNMCTIEGGMTMTDNEEACKKARLIVNQGQEKKYYHTELGYNFRMTEIQAVIGMNQLGHLDKWNLARINNAEFLIKNLSGIESIVPPFISENAKHVFHQFTILGQNRDRLQEHLLKKEIQTSIFYPIAIYRQPLYQKMGFDTRLENVEHITSKILSLPVHPSVSRDDLKKIVSEVENFYGK